MDPEVEQRFRLNDVAHLDICEELRETRKDIKSLGDKLELWTLTQTQRIGEQDGKILNLNTMFRGVWVSVSLMIAGLSWTFIEIYRHVQKG
jgi:hypothetical protein